MKPSVFSSSEVTANPEFSQRYYSEEEMIEFARRMMFEIVLGNKYYLHDEGAVRAKLPPTP